MKNMNMEDLNAKNEVSAEEAAAVKGGPIYMKYDGIRGNVAQSSEMPTESISFNYTEIKF